MEERYTNMKDFYKGLMSVMEEALDDAMDDSESVVEPTNTPDPTVDDREPADYPEVMDLSTTSKLDKLNAIIHNTLNDLIVGDLKLENAAELSSTINAVYFYNKLKAEFYAK